MENRNTYPQRTVQFHLLPLYALHLTTLLLAAVSIGNLLGGFA